MSHFVTGNGVVVTCAAPDCACNAATAGAVAAADEERWFDEVCDHIEPYLKAYEAHRDAPKGQRDALEPDMHEAKRNVIDRFYSPRWDR